MSILSHPLPADVALPATAQNFVVQLFECAAEKPDASTVQQIHRLVYGACQPILGVLTPSILSRLEGYIFSILKTSSGVEDQSLGMYCLAIMRVILEKFQTEIGNDDIWPTFDHSADSADSQWTPHAIRQFFHGNKTHKTMQLLVLRVIWACRPESADPTGQGLVSVNLVNQIIAGMSSIAVLDWSQKNPVIVRKLQEKCLVPDMQPALRFQVLTFMGAMSDKVALPAQAMLFYEKTLLELDSSSLSHDQLNLSLRLSIGRISTKFRPEWWHGLFDKIMDLLIDPPPAQILRVASIYMLLLDHIARLVESHDLCRRGLLGALSSGYARQRLEIFFTSSGVLSSPEMVEHPSKVCIATFSSLKIQLISSMCSLLLRTALVTPQDEDLTIRQMLPALLQHHARGESGNLMCSICTQTRSKALQRSAPFVEIEATPESQDVNLHWKERLGSVMRTHAKYQETSLVASFINICHDLEARCENIEEPLRQERKRFSELEARHGALNKAFVELEGHIMDRDLRISALEAETDRHDTDMAAASQESRELMHRIDQAAKELQDANENARKAIAAITQEKHDIEVEHATALACKQEDVERVREQLHNVTTDSERLRSEIENIKHSRGDDKAEYDKLRAECEHLEQQLVEGQQRIAQVEDERATLLQGHTHLEQDISKLQQEIDRHQQRHDDLLVELETIKQSSKEEAQKTLSSFENAMSRANQEWKHVKDSLDEQLQATRHELAIAEDNFQQQHEADKHKISDYRKRIERLKKDCLEKDAQVSEAQEMRNRLMNAMGLGGMMAPPPEPALKSSVLPVRSASTASATPRATAPSQMPYTPAPGSQQSGVDDDDDDPNSTFMSDASVDNGPTPKRARPRPSAKTVCTQEKRTSIAPRSARSIMRSRSAIKRQPLQDMPTNRSSARHAKPPSKVAFHDDHEFGVSTAERREVEDWSFSADCIMTGTPGIGLRHGEGGGLDDSTADV